MNRASLKNLLSFVDIALLKGLKTELAIAAILVVIGVFFFKFVHLEAEKAVKAAGLKNEELRAEIARAGADIKAAEDIKRSLEAAAINMRLLEARLNAMRERLPSNKRAAGILADLARTGTEQGVRITAIKPLPVEEKGELLRLPFQINAEGGFFAFGEYIDAVERLARIVVVDNFMLEGTEGEDRLTSQIFISAYALGPARVAQASNGGQAR